MNSLLPLLLLCALTITAIPAPSSWPGQPTVPLISTAPKTTVALVNDSLKRAQANADSTLRQHRYDSLQTIQKRFLDQYRSFPSTADSIYTLATIRPHALFGCDGSGLTDAIAFSPRLYKIPLAVSSQLNRIGYHGFLMPPDGASAFGATTDQGTDMLTIPSLTTVQSDLLTGIVPDQPLTGLVAPHTSIYWENGLFNGNLLGVRFARPLTRNATVAIVSNYRNMPLVNYSHGHGNIYTFYADLVSDTSLLVHYGRNGLTDEQISGFQLAWQDTTRLSASLTGSYFDIKNERARELSSVNGPRLGWERLYQFGSQAAARFDGPLTPVISLHSGGAFKKYGSALAAAPDFGSAFAPVQGRVFDYGFWLEPTLTLGKDTARISYHYSVDTREQYTRATGIAWPKHAAKVSYCKTIEAAPFRGYILGQVGGINAETPESVAQYPTALLRIQATLPHGTGNGYIIHHALEKQPSLDTADNTMASSPYSGAGGEITLSNSWGGLLLGYHFKTTLNQQVVASYWPNHNTPFIEPGQVVVVTPFAGRIGGFTASSRWYIADRRPYLKSYSELSYEASVMQGREHLRADLGLDYWGARDPISFGGIETWNREIYNLSLKLSVQIETFRLFYKMDNLLNRSIAYVPGYMLPGLTFRWGFGWIIPG